MASRALTTWRKERRERLDDLLQAHQSVGEGFPLVLSTYRDWRQDLDGLAANLDAETATQLGQLFQRQRPW